MGIYYFTTPTRFKGKRHKAGAPIELSVEAAKAGLAAGWLSETDPTAALVPAAPDLDGPVISAETFADIQAELEAAIAARDTAVAEAAKPPPEPGSELADALGKLAVSEAEHKKAVAEIAKRDAALKKLNAAAKSKK